jgi:DNA-binding NarL/FixJ family response regulator
VAGRTIVRPKNVNRGPGATWGSAIAGEEHVTAHPAGWNDACLEQRKDDMPATEDQRTRSVEALEQRQHPIIAARAIAQAGAGAAYATSPLDLTARERDVVVLVAAGLTKREIADRLVKGNPTVDSHVRSTLGKSGFRSRFQLADRAVEHRLAAPPN